MKITYSPSQSVAVALFRAALGLLIFCATVGHAQEPPAPPTLSELARTHGVKIIMLRARETRSIRKLTYRFRKSEALETAVYLPILQRALALYPKGFLRRCRITTITLARDVEQLGAAAAKETPPAWSIGVAVDFGRREMILDVGTLRARDVHSGIFQFVDDVATGESKREKLWYALNPKGFAYILGGLDMPDGFVSRLATFNHKRDRAETFSYMVTQFSAVKQLTTTDKRLYAKLATTMVFMKSFDSTLNTDWWRRAIAAYAPPKKPDAPAKPTPPQK